MSFVEQLRATLAQSGSAVSASSHWEGVLRMVKGTIWPDGLERISVAALFDGLGVAPQDQTLEAARKLREIMVDLGWSPMAAHDVPLRGKGLVTSYARLAQ